MSRSVRVERSAAESGEAVDPAGYYFRLFLRFSTGDPGYRWLNRTLAVASAARNGNAVDYQAYTLS